MREWQRLLKNKYVYNPLTLLDYVILRQKPLSCPAPYCNNFSEDLLQTYVGDTVGVTHCGRHCGTEDR